MHFRYTCLLLAVACCAVSCQAPPASPPATGSPFDLVIRGGRIVDGTGNPWFVADVGIKGDTIAAIAPHLDATHVTTVEAAGLVVAPGFIDVHSHADAGVPAGPNPNRDPLVRDDGQDLIGNPAAENNVRQGVTTVFAGPDGAGSPKVGDYLKKVTAAQPAINVGAFVGHGAVRVNVVGMENRPATAAELQKMRELVSTAMQEGAFGLSTGLYYVPANYAPLSEVIDLASVAGRFGGMHQSHMRNEAADVLASVRDTIRIGEEGHLPTQITHHKVMGKPNWGKTVDTLRLIDEARARGVDVTIDQYPYTASSSTIDSGLLEPWAQEGGRAALLARLKDSKSRQRILSEITKALEVRQGNGDPSSVSLASCSFDPALAGKSLADLLRERSRPVTREQAAEVVVELLEKGSCLGVYHSMSEDDLIRVMKHPATMIASDAFPGIPTFGKDVPHPRAYGTFARVLGVYVREQAVLTLEEAVRKMSSLPAMRMGLTDRGVLRPGMKADIVIFNPSTVIDKATFEKPHQYAEGVSHVFVNGQLTLENGKMTGKRAGRALRHQGGKANAT